VLSEPTLTAYRVGTPLPIIPAGSSRAWMDETPNHYAYRCTPLSIANSSGWEILAPSAFNATWNGYTHENAIEVDGDGAASFAVSHFGSGILTFHVGYVFRTSPGWALWVRGSPNTAKDGIVPLDGIVETDWLPFTFTMNWRFTRPGTVQFEKDEPVCFISLFPHSIVDEVQPKLAELSDEPGLADRHAKWSIDRLDFNAGLKSGDSGAVAQGWQRLYLKGKSSDGAQASFHRHKRRLHTFEPLPEFAPK
jgi:hypothetical protein